MINNVPGESNRVRRLFCERFTFQISIDTYHVLQGLAVAEAALEGGVTILELGTPLLKYEGVRNVVPIFRQRFPKALLLADMKTMDGGGGEANAVYSGGFTTTVLSPDAPARKRRMVESRMELNRDLGLLACHLRPLKQLQLRGRKEMREGIVAVKPDRLAAELGRLLVGAGIVLGDGRIVDPQEGEGIAG
jgi:hypothetical protein